MRVIERHDPRPWDTSCDLCDAPPVIALTVTPDSFLSSACNHCGGERLLCLEHWDQFVAELAEIARQQKEKLT